MNEFLKKIEEFLASSGMSATNFGIKAMNNPTFVFDIRNGRQCLDSTKDKVLDFINNYKQEE
jgi:hypothetical protein